MTAAHAPAWARPSQVLDLLRLAIPVVISRASFMLMSVTDAIVLARHSPRDLPLVLDAWLPNGVVMGLGLGLMLGVSVLTAELNGSGRGAETGRIFRRGLVFGAIYAVLATALVIVTAPMLFHLFGFAPGLADAIAQTTQILALGVLGHMVAACCQFYLEALRRPNIVTVVSLSAVVVNLVSALILVPQYGAVGVVWGTTLSRFYMATVFLLIVWRLTPAFKRSPKGPRTEGRRQNTVGAGTGIANVAEWGAFNLTFVIASMVSMEAGAVYGLAVQVMGVVFMVHVGLGTATSVRVAEYFGRSDAEGVRAASRLGVAASVVVGSMLAIAVLLLREPMAAGMLNASDPATGGADLAPELALLLGAVALVTLFDGLQGVGSMALRAQGVVWTPTAIHVGSYVGLMLPMCWFLALAAGQGVWGVYAGITAASVCAGLGQVAVLEWKSRRPNFRAIAQPG